ncbi:MAG: hypothetical protein PVH00_14480 [Gemmatimonadota bacterium]
MSRVSIDVWTGMRRTLCVAACASTFAATASAQMPGAEPGRWRLGAATGAWAPFSSLIRAADSNDTRLAAGPAFALELQYVATDAIAGYVSGLLALPTVRLGSSIQPAVTGPSNQVLLFGGTAGVVLTADWLGSPIHPTLRLGGGFKAYHFDLSGADGQLRPTADVGIGFRGVGQGPLEVMAEIRYLPSAFDQGSLPTRGIAPQSQRQHDLLLSIGIAVHPGGS